VPLYLTLTQLSRSAKAYYPIMLLLILTLGLGVYNSSAARTIDLNSTERTLYEYGTDIVVTTVWEGYSESLPTNPGNGNPGGENPGGENPGGENPGGENPGGENPGGNPRGSPGGNPNGGFSPPPVIRYVEPPFQVFKALPGVKDATRVLLTTGNAVVSGRSAGKVNVMGIENVSFSKVGWFERKDLFPAHPYEYLNLLGLHEQPVLIPTSFAEEYHLKEGDLVKLNIEQQALEFVVMGILPYWPSQYPQESPFFITNIDFIYDQLPVIPYEVWMKMEEGAKATPVVEALSDQGIQLASIKDVRIELAQQEKHPSRGGVFGILSLGFLVSVAISLIGYILYWFFNLSSRVVQFGVLRAMGLSRKQLTGMLLLEQGFTAGLSIGLGILIGKLASYLYLPFLQTTSNAELQVPPFRVIFDSRDTMQLYMVVAFMMFTGAALLFLHIRRLKVHQAVKLGEER
jgi:putative ABC transport system permease protein